MDMQQVWLVLWLARLPLLAANADAVVVAPSPLAACLSSETSRYRVSAGLWGSVAELTLQIAPQAESDRATPFPSSLRAVAEGAGNVLGMGKASQRIESEVDVRDLIARRWKNARSSGGNGNNDITDTAVQSQTGTVAMVRKRPGQSDHTDSITQTLPMFDPVGFLIHLRLDLPTKPTTYHVLDGQELWRVVVAAARTGPDTQDMVRVDGELQPIRWDGNPDRERKSYAFSMFFANDRFRALTKVVAPFGLGEINVDLVQLERTPTTDVARAFYCDSPKRPSLASIIAGFVRAAARAQAQK